MNQTVEAAVLSGAHKNLPPGTAAATTKHLLTDFAREVGFDSCRIATCAPPPPLNEFHDWLDQGAHGEMDYMSRGEERRGDPDRILPGAKSILGLALNYLQGSEPDW